MPLPGPITYPLATWLRDEGTRPEGSFVAWEGDQVVGYAGLCEHANGPATAEHGLTVVRRDRRRRGVARALKESQLHWASATGVVEARHVDAARERGDAGPEHRSRLPKPRPRAHDAGADAVIDVRLAEVDADLRAWAEVKSRVEPDDPLTVEQLARHRTPDRVLLVAELDGRVVGCGAAGLSTLAGLAFVNPRVLPEARGRGVGQTLAAPLVAHARSLGVDGIVSYVNAADARSIAFARAFGLEEVDYQLEQFRAIGDEPRPPLPDGHRDRPGGGRTSCAPRTTRSGARATTTWRSSAGRTCRSTSGCAWRRRGRTARSSRCTRARSWATPGMWEHANGHARPASTG